MKDQAASILASIKRQSRELNINMQTCLQLFCQEEFLRRLSLSNYVSNFILKGGMFIYTLTNFQSRVTQDIDFMLYQLSNERDHLKQLIEEIISIQTEQEYIYFEITKIRDITVDRKYHGINVKLIGHIKNVRVPFSIDIGIDDVIVPSTVLREIKPRLEGFQKPLLYTYSIESTIAEKFDAILTLMEATSRMKDFFDLYYLSGLYEFDGNVLRQAIHATLQHRQTVLDETKLDRIRLFSTHDILCNLWGRYQPITQMELPEFHIVIERILEFLSPVYESIIKNTKFQKHWDRNLLTWH